MFSILQNSKEGFFFPCSDLQQEQKIQIRNISLFFLMNQLLSEVSCRGEFYFLLSVVLLSSPFVHSILVLFRKNFRKNILVF
jgi:hypothetical protein